MIFKYFSVHTVFLLWIGVCNTRFCIVNKKDVFVNLFFLSPMHLSA